MRRCQCYWRTCVACRTHTAFQDVLLLLLVVVVSVEINQKENVHLPLGSVLSVRRPGVVRVAPGWEVYVEVLCGRVGFAKSAMSGSVVVTSRRTTVVFLPSADSFQEETALIFPSAGLPGHHPKLLVTQQLASCRNSFGVRIETSQKSARLRNQSREI